MINQSKFIRTPISKILLDAVGATSGVGDGIETYPLSDYVMQSVFLKMTGFQEQKMKAICWEMATNNYDYRYEFTKNKQGECSTYNDKRVIYADLIMQIKHFKNLDPNDKTITNIISENYIGDDILTEAESQVKAILSDTNLSVWSQKSFNDYENTLVSKIKPKHYANEDSNLFSHTSDKPNLINIYNNHLYKRRNRIAHNTQSYKQNLPTLTALQSADYQYENYFLFFFILTLIDGIFIALYDCYTEALNDVTTER